MSELDDSALDHRGDAGADPPLWLCTLEWVLIVCVIVAIGCVITELYWSLAFLWLSAQLWSGLVRFWRRRLS